MISLSSPPPQPSKEFMKMALTDCVVLALQQRMTKTVSFILFIIKLNHGYIKCNAAKMLFFAHY